MNAPDDPLSGFLQDWRVRPPPYPLFRPAVQARIARSGWRGYLGLHPALWSLVAASVLALAWYAGRSAGLARDRADRNLLANTYVNQLDPRSQAGPSG